MLKKLKNNGIIFLFLISFVIISCNRNSKNPEYNPSIPNILYFGGANWKIYTDSGYSQPLTDRVFIDAVGQLHIKFVKQDNIWYGVKIVSKDANSYGTYKFDIKTNSKQLPDNVNFLVSGKNNSENNNDNISEFGYKIFSHIREKNTKIQFYLDDSKNNVSVTYNSPKPVDFSQDNITSVFDITDKVIKFNNYVDFSKEKQKLLDKFEVSNLVNNSGSSEQNQKSIIDKNIFIEFHLNLISKLKTDNLDDVEFIISKYEFK
jgi:hypothetical protein